MNIGIGKVRTKLLDTDHKQWNCGMGIFDPNKVFMKPDSNGKVIVDDIRCKIVRTQEEAQIGSVKIGDKIYPTTRIGNLIWLAENLDFIPEGVEFITSGTSTPDSPTCSYWQYSDNGKGLLYNGYAISNIESQIPGWRVPTMNDWNALFTAIGGNTVDNLKKIRNTTGWPTYQGTNETNLSIIPNGNRGTNGTFTAENAAYFWANTPSSDTVYYRIRIEQNTIANSYAYSVNNSYSVRLVADV